MAPVFDPKVIIGVKALSDAGMTPKDILMNVNIEKPSISRRSVFRVKNSEGKRNQSILSGLPEPPRKRVRIVRTPSVIKKVALKVNKENPKSLRQVAKEVGISPRLVNKIIHQDLG